MEDPFPVVNKLAEGAVAELIQQRLHKITFQDLIDPGKFLIIHNPVLSKKGVFPTHITVAQFFGFV